MSDNQFKCTGCSKSYVYKTGLTAHIKNKHPIQGSSNTLTGSKPTPVTKASLPADSGCRKCKLKENSMEGHL